MMLFIAIPKTEYYPDVDSIIFKTTVFTILPASDDSRNNCLAYSAIFLQNITH